MILIVLVIVIVMFGFVLLFGAPYLPTLKKQQIQALELLDLKKGQTLLELGCGDGRVLNYAAKLGLRAVGYELNPILFLIAKMLTWRNRRQITVKYGNFWVTKWPQADGIYVFLLAKYMKKLDKKITQEYKGKNVKLVSYTFDIPNKKPVKQLEGMFFYEY